MSNCILDSTAVLACLLNEQGGDIVRPLLRGGLISSVNAAEVIYKTFTGLRSITDHLKHFQRLEMEVVNFDLTHAGYASTLNLSHHSAKLSFADRACLALAMQRKVPVYTANEHWPTFREMIDVRCIRRQVAA